MKPRLILASASPRRRQLLREADYEFEVDPSGIDEPDPIAEMSPWAYAAAPGLAEGRGSRQAAGVRA